MRLCNDRLVGGGGLHLPFPRHTKSLPEGAFLPSLQERPSPEPFFPRKKM